MISFDNFFKFVDRFSEVVIEFDSFKLINRDHIIVKKL